MKLQDMVSKITVHKTNPNKLSREILRSVKHCKIIQQYWNNVVTANKLKEAIERESNRVLPDVKENGCIYVIFAKHYTMLKYFDFNGKSYKKPLTDQEVKDYLTVTSNLQSQVTDISIR